jgi:nucleoside-diphosphate-sugar epimerase
VYGPRDREFLRLFRASANHIHPRPSPQPLSLVFVKDLAEAVVHCLAQPGTRHGTYFVAHTEIVTSRQVANEIAAQTGGWGVPLPLPGFAFWPLCLLSEALTRLSGKPSVLSLEKYTELTAPGWVCTPAKLKRAANFECMTDLRKGISLTLDWYRKEGWVKS